MSTFIINECRAMLRPIYFISYIIFLLITWQLCLPPFQQKVIFDSYRILNFYLIIASTAGMICLFLLQISNTVANKSYSYQSQMAVIISGETYFWGKYISFYLMFFLAFILPAMLFAMIQQLIFAPDRIDVCVYLFGLVGFVLSFFHLIIYFALCLIAYLKNEFLSLVSFLCSYLILILITRTTGINIFNSQVLFYNITDATFIYIILWSLCGFLMIKLGNYQSRNILYAYDIPPLKPHTFSRIVLEFTHILRHIIP